MLSKFAKKAFNEYLLFTNFALGSTFMFGGDLLAQKLTKDGPHDWQRTSRFLESVHKAEVHRNRTFSIGDSHVFLALQKTWPLWAPASG